MTKKILVALLLIAMMIIGFIVFQFSTKSSISADTFIQGNLTIGTTEVRTVPHGAVLRVTGDLTVNGKLECDTSPEAPGVLAVEVGGTFKVNGKLECLPMSSVTPKETPALTIVAQKINFSKVAAVFVNGSVDIVHEKSLLLSSPEEIATLRTASMSEKSAQTYIGPFTLEDPRRTLSENLGTARAKAPDTVAEIRGTWHIGDAETQDASRLHGAQKGILHPFIRIDMGNENRVTLEALTISGADGQSGKDDVGTNCVVVGGPGGDGLFFRLNAGEIVVTTAEINLGNGGQGGNAETRINCRETVANGGDGGKPGNIFWTAAQQMTLSKLTIVGGKGGNGGHAKASADNGKDGCPGEAGGGATATGGAGGASGYALSAGGTVSGLNDITVTRIVGGTGGNATALPGKGGDGNSCGCGGGRGGVGVATPGDGGVAHILLFSQTGEAHGGDTGNTRVVGGAGGNGASCVAETKGGDGGMGGNAVAGASSAGKGTTAYGNTGIIESVIGGSGGNGGDGCPAGLGGIGGLGAPLGTNGNAGNFLCAKADIYTQPKDTTIPLISAILYHGYYLPKDQLMVSTTAGCGAAHWRAVKGQVITTNGTTIPDPIISACGFGKVSENPLVTTPAKILDIKAMQ